MNKDSPTKEAFDKLLRWLDPDRDRAGEKYERLRLRVIRIFVSRGCCEAEDLADRTINVVTSKMDWLIENYQGDPALYFYAVAKKILQEQRKRRPPPNVPPPEPASAELEQTCSYLDDCLSELPLADRDLVLRYQEGVKQERIENRKKLARELKISRNALRIKVHHIHAWLRECLERRVQT
jgi:hypothetical protein